MKHYAARTGRAEDPGWCIEDDGTEGGMAKGRPFTERELDIMSSLWGEGSGTVAEVREELPHALGYTGVLKMLQILEEKGWYATNRKGVRTGTSQ